MANTLTTNPILISEEGIISVRPIWIRTARFFRAVYSDVATFTYWDENETADHTFNGETAALSTATFTSTGKFVSGAPAANDIMRITLTSSGNNEFVYQASAAGDNDDFVMDTWNTYHGTLTDEDTKLYSWKIWTPKVAFSFKAGLAANAEETTDTIDFGDKGVRFNNLAVHTLTSGATIELYVR